jgi:hypothetical protein
MILFILILTKLLTPSLAPREKQKIGQSLRRRLALLKTYKVQNSKQYNFKKNWAEPPAEASTFKNLQSPKLKIIQL